MVRCKVCVLVADPPLARVKVRDVSCCPGEPPQYSGKQFSKLNSLDSQLHGKTIYFLKLFSVEV